MHERLAGDAHEYGPYRDQRNYAERRGGACRGAPLHGASHYVCIEVRDTGAGMSSETLEHIFEPFFTTKQPGEGSGLGLAVAHGIVQTHEGAITVTSRAGEGTSFFVYLPACEAAPKSPEQLRRPHRARRRAARAVHRRRGAARFARGRTLERAGFRCTGEKNAARAIELVRHTPDSFDLVITDLNMPGMSGLDVARELFDSRDLPVVITTGYVPHRMSPPHASSASATSFSNRIRSMSSAVVQKHLATQAS